MAKKRYNNSGGIWPAYVKCKTGNLIVGGGNFQMHKQTVPVTMFANLPDNTPKELVKLHKEYWKQLAKFHKKNRKKLEKKEKSVPPFFSLRKSSSK